MITEMAFSESEYRARVERLRRTMSNTELDCVVCVGPEPICYFSGYDAHTHFSEQALVIGCDGDPALVIRDVDVAPAEDSSWVQDLRLYHFGESGGETPVAQAVRDLSPGARRIGLDLGNGACSGQYALRLIEACKPAEIVDAGVEINAARLVKSAAELDCVRQAARYAEAGLEAARAALEPGITEIAFAGAIERGLRDAGSDYAAMPTWVASGPRNRGGHRTPTSRVIEKGDTVKTEFAGVERRYHAVTMQTFSIGEPSTEARAIYDASREALVAGSSAVLDGQPIAVAERQAVASLRGSGFDASDMSRFGYGVGLQFPPTWLEPLDIITQSSSDFATGMTFVLHVGMKDSSLRHGALVGGAYLIGENGLECLSGGPSELLVI